MRGLLTMTILNHAVRKVPVLAMPLLVIALLQINSFADQNDKGASAFKGNCASCHGDDGAGTALGKAMQAPDLRSEDVQKQPDAELNKAISEGKNNMPAFKSTLSAEQIQALVKHVRSLGKTKTSQK
jgi:mono/diheme cytochrome c family protein